LSDNDGKAWVAYVIYVDPEKMDKIFLNELHPILTTLSESGRRLNFNFYTDAERPHISIRMNDYSYRVEHILKSLSDSKLIDDWEQQPYDATEKIRTAYEVASKSALTAKKLLDKYDSALYDDEFVDHLLHGFMDAIGFHRYCDEAHVYFSLLERMLKSIKQKMEDVLHG